MKFSEIIAQASALLRDAGRMTYRTLKREFALDDEMLDDLREELITARRIAVDENGTVLVWVGAAPVPSSEFQVPRQDAELRTANSERSPVSYTPPHLAERIRATSLTDGERKTITALFADLKGSTALIEGLDPEDARAIIDPALQLMMDAVHRYEGYVAQALGDGIFALFGAPLAHEDHPQRALYAALRMQEEMRRYADTLRTKGYPPPLMRVGINTGEVVLRSIRKDDLHADYVPVGHSTNLAARMEQLAASGSILVTAYTYRLTEGYFAFKDLGQTLIKGVEESQAVYEVLGAGPLRTRLQVAARRGLTQFVGRQSEMEQIRRALEEAKAVHGQIVGVMGEPGLGKSRLFYEFKLLSQSGCLILEAYSVSHGKASPYLPVSELLKSYFRIDPQDDERTRREKVAGKVVMLDRSIEDTLPYLFAMLGIEEQPSPLQQMDPQIRRKRTFETLKKLFLRESLNQPLILIFEDLHWIDSETQEFLDTLSERVASAKILLLVNYRPEYRHEWSSKTYYTQLRLTPFGKAEAEEFLSALLGPEPNLTALKQLILTKTEGTPFFMEEIVQELKEQGVLRQEASVGWVMTHPTTTTALQMPPTVQGVLAARIDRLAPDEKALLQQLAVIGREFPLGLVRQVIAQPEDELYRLLSSLQHKEFLYEQPAFPEVEYLFKHVLTQEVAYNSVLIERRKALHELTAQAVEQLHHDRLEEHYSELAHHYSRGGNTEKAIEYLQKAGQQAALRSAYAEAITHLTIALELLKPLSKTGDRDQRELSLQIALGPMVAYSKGFTVTEVEDIYKRAYELCQHVGTTAQLFPVVLGLRTFYHLRGQLQRAREFGEQLLTIAQNVQEPAFFVIAHRALGATLFLLGDFAPARTHLEQSLALYDSQHHRTDSALYGQSPGVLGRNYLAWTLWSLGYAEQASQRIQESITVAHDLGDPNSLTTALTGAVTLDQYRREAAASQEQAEALIAAATEHGIPSWLAWGTALGGWALATQGRTEEGIAQMQKGLALFDTTWSGSQRSHLLVLLAEAYGKAGQLDAAQQVLVEALAAESTTGERYYETELYRLKGELILQQFNVQGSTFKVENPQSAFPNPQLEAEECFRKAIEIAQKQQAKSLELRATMSLVRLRLQQAAQRVSRTTQHETRTRLADAHTMLSDIYHWFTEGFDTKDLQEAKALLEELTGPAHSVRRDDSE